MSRGEREQQVGVADGVQRRGTAEDAADLFAPDGFAHEMHDNERSFGCVAQPQQALAQGGHGGAAT